MNKLAISTFVGFAVVLLALANYLWNGQDLAIDLLTSMRAADSVCLGTFSLSDSQKSHRAVVVFDALPEEKRDELLRMSWKIPYYDDGYDDDGVPFELTFVEDWGRQGRVRPLAGRARRAWLEDLKRSKALILIRSQTIGGQPEADALCLGVPVIVVDFDPKSPHAELEGLTEPAVYRVLSNERDSLLTTLEKAIEIPINFTM